MLSTTSASQALDPSALALDARDPPTADLIRLPLSRSADSELTAQAVGLTYASTSAPGFSRRAAGKGFSYRDVRGRRIEDKLVLRRIRGLVIPPAWTSVWICPDANGHIQAVGVDDKGRRQYIYHERFREIRESSKFEHILGFAEQLPRLRERVAADIGRRGVGRRQVLASVVRLLETTMIRVGNRSYARANGSYGLTTLEQRHVRIAGERVRFHFRGKSGKLWKLDIQDRRIVRIIKSCQELPGQTLFQYVDEDGEPQTVTSNDVNDYLREITSADITAKDFRTWNGTVLAATALAAIGPAANDRQARKNVSRVIADVAARLGNTAAICRKCYVHPAVISAYLAGRLALEPPSYDTTSPTPDEAGVLAFLRGREAG